MSTIKAPGDSLSGKGLWCPLEASLLYPHMVEGGPGRASRSPSPSLSFVQSAYVYFKAMTIGAHGKICKHDSW